MIHQPFRLVIASRSHTGTPVQARPAHALVTAWLADAVEHREAHTGKCACLF